MHNKDQKPAAAVISFAITLLITVPFIAFAQTEALPVIVPDAPVEVPALPEIPTQTETPATTDEQTTEAVQETATSTQTTAGADELAGTANPEEGATESEQIPVDDASSTPTVETEIIPIVDEAPALAPDEIPVAAVTDLTVVVSDIKATEVIELSNKELNARIEPDFVMQISGKKIPTARALGDSESVSAIVDATSQVLTVTGSCSDVYYVVLLYKNQTDYQTDPASYILNRAYACENGSYTYAVADLPASVKNGTYYLLIGEQGDQGSWRPVTELTEVSINRSN